MHVSAERSGILGIELGNATVRAVVVNPDSGQVIKAAQSAVIDADDGVLDIDALLPSLEDVLYQLDIDARRACAVGVTIGPRNSGVGSGPALRGWLESKSKMLAEAFSCSGQLGVSFAPTRAVTAAVSAMQSVGFKPDRVDLAPVAAARVLGDEVEDAITVGSGCGWRARMRKSEVLEAVEAPDVSYDDPLCVIRSNGFSGPIMTYTDVKVSHRLRESYRLDFSQMAPAVGAAIGVARGCQGNLLTGDVIYPNQSPKVEPEQKVQLRPKMEPAPQPEPVSVPAPVIARREPVSAAVAVRPEPILVPAAAGYREPVPVRAVVAPRPEPVPAVAARREPVRLAARPQPAAAVAVRPAPVADVATRPEPVAARRLEPKPSKPIRRPGLSAHSGRPVRRADAHPTPQSRPAVAVPDPIGRIAVDERPPPPLREKTINLGPRRKGNSIERNGAGINGAGVNGHAASLSTREATIPQRPPSRTQSVPIRQGAARKVALPAAAPERMLPIDRADLKPERTRPTSSRDLVVEDDDPIRQFSPGISDAEATRRGHDRSGQDLPTSQSSSLSTTAVILLSVAALVLALALLIL